MFDTDDCYPQDVDDVFPHLIEPLNCCVTDCPFNSRVQGVWNSGGPRGGEWVGFCHKHAYKHEVMDDCLWLPSITGHDMRWSPKKPSWALF